MYRDQYAIFWAKKYEEREEQDAELIQDAEHIFVSFEGNFRHPNEKMVYVSRLALLLIDYNEEFWVIDKVNIHKNKESVDIHLKLAVFE